ncbi:MAG: HEAT repeat domain-containing protein [Chloroflexota bacterium]|nr:HEAT repeat domain-containing protein [Chloroflexota bacterium]
MPPRQTDQEQADFASALRSVADEEAMPQAEVDALSMLEGADLARFREVWAALAAPARARLIRALHGAAEKRLRLDFSALNQLALDDPDARVRLAGIQSALEDRSPALLDRLLAILRDDQHIELRVAAAEDLARFALLAELEDLDRDAAARLRAALEAAAGDQAEDPRVRNSALAALGYFSDLAMMERLAGAFSLPALRLGAVRGMGRSADPRWTDRLMPVLGSDDPRMRLEAARALGEIEDERAVTPLVEVMDDPVPEVRLAVINALGAIGGEEAREALLYAAEDADDAIREAVHRALQAIEEAEGDPLDL